MGLIHRVEVRPLKSRVDGMATFYTPQASHQTMLVQVAPGTVDNLFVHHFQTDQLLVVRNSMILVALQNRRYHYLYLSDRNPQVVTIPPGIPHGAINLAAEPCILLNALLRHGPSHDRDYRPLEKPFPYDMNRVRSLWQHPQAWTATATAA